MVPTRKDARAVHRRQRGLVPLSLWCWDGLRINNLSPFTPLERPFGFRSSYLHLLIAGNTQKSGNWRPLTLLAPVSRTTLATAALARPQWRSMALLLWMTGGKTLLSY